jgi:hypothetical protein
MAVTITGERVYGPGVSGISVTAVLAAATSTAVAPSVVGSGSSGAPVFVSVGPTSTVPLARPSTCEFDVPPGVTGANTQIVLISFLLKNDATVIGPPTGFVEAPASFASGPVYNLRVFWKRPTAADTGVYIFNFNSLNGISGLATLYDGCVTSGVPIEGAVSAVDPDATNNITTGLFTNSNGPNRTAVWVVNDPTDSNTTFPGGFTKRFFLGTPTSGSGMCSQADSVPPIANAGPVPASGTLIAGTALNSQSMAWLGLLIPIGGTGPAGGASLPANLPFNL